MQYMLLIYMNEADFNRRPATESSKISQEYGTYTQEIKASGNLLAGERLEAASTATIVRVREGKTLSTDGPFAETREQLGGYYIVEAKDLDEAVGLAARIPGARWGSIEVRPVVKMG